MRLSPTMGKIVLCATLLSGCPNDYDFWDWWHHGPGHGGPHHPPPGPTCPDESHFVSGELCIRKAQKISVADDYSCAILHGGALKCWGENQFRKLGLGDSESRGDAPGELGDALPFVQVGTDRTLLDVATDRDITCGLLDNGKVKCWGYDGYGGVSSIPNSWTGQMGDALPYSPVPADSAVVDLAAGAGYGFALLADGRLYLWGTSANLLTYTSGSNVVELERGSSYTPYHYCGLLTDGSVRCGGWGMHGELGIAPEFATPAGGYPAVALGTGRTATQLALGDEHSCALLDDGSVKCWGRNQRGQLGLGDTLDRGLDASTMGDLLPAVPLGQTAQAIAAGTAFTCALLDDGSVKCWGQNDAGQLGQGDTEDRGDAPGEVAALVPVELGPGQVAVAIDAGTHTCVILANGGVKCWGPNVQGQLGLGTTDARGDAPGEVAALPPIDLGS